MSAVLFLFVLLSVRVSIVAGRAHDQIQTQIGRRTVDKLASPAAINAREN